MALVPARLDSSVHEDIRLDCMGGFVVSMSTVPGANVPFDLELLKERYQKELRWQLGNPEREDLILRLWIEAIQEERAQ